MRAAAQIISVLFHPLLLPTYTFLYVMYINPYIVGGWASPQMKIAILQVFINSFMFPVLFMVLLKGLGFVDNLELKTREERFVPFIATMIFYIWTYFVFKRSGLPEIFSDIILAATMAIVLAFITTIFYHKISLHGIGMGLVFAFCINTFAMSSLNLLPMVFLIVLLSGVVGTARLILQAHQPRELYVGFAVGLLCMNFALLL